MPCPNQALSSCSVLVTATPIRFGDQAEVMSEVFVAIKQLLPIPCTARYLL
jgi:hypothetical protein